MSGEGEPYTCGNCGGTFVKGWSDEEAMDEALSLIPASQLLEEPPAVVCDPCFQVIMEWAKAIRVMGATWHPAPEPGSRCSGQAASGRT